MNPYHPIENHKHGKHKHFILDGIWFRYLYYPWSGALGCVRGGLSTLLSQAFRPCSRMSCYLYSSFMEELSRSWRSGTFGLRVHGEAPTFVLCDLGELLTNHGGLFSGLYIPCSSRDQLILIFSRGNFLSYINTIRVNPRPKLKWFS